MGTNDITGDRLISKVSSEAFGDGHDRIFGNKEVVEMSSERSDFEKWYSNQRRDQIATWHEDEQRYTKFSAKQFAWEVWQAAINF